MTKKPSKDRASLCTFTFADGRRCSSPRSGAKYDLCFFPLVKLRQRQLAEQAGQEVAAPLNADYLNACDLSAAFANLFVAVAQGRIKPKVASTLANIGQLLLRTQPLAKEEFRFAYGNATLRDAILATFNPHDDEPNDDSGELDEPDESAELGDPEEPDNSTESEVPDESGHSTEPDSPPPSTNQIAPSAPDSPNPAPPPYKVVFR